MHVGSVLLKIFKFRFMPSKGSRLLVHFNTAQSFALLLILPLPSNLVIFSVKQDDFTLLLSSEAGTIDLIQIEVRRCFVATVGAFLCCSAAPSRSWGCSLTPVASRRRTGQGWHPPSQSSIRPPTSQLAPPAPVASPGVSVPASCSPSCPTHEVFLFFSRKRKRIAR